MTHLFNDNAGDLDHYAQVKCAALALIDQCQRGDQIPDDRGLWLRLVGMLPMIGCKAVAAFTGDVQGWQWVCPLDDEDRDAIIHLIQSLRIDTLIPLNVTVLNGFTLLPVAVNGRTKDRSGLVLFINPDPRFHGGLSSPQARTHWYPYAATVREVFRQRNSMYQHFPAALSLAYWRTCVESKSRVPAPWKSNRNTITLSLDLRKSTFAMEQAESNEGFATWMRDTVNELTKVALSHGAVFDKFTGDGIMAHFLQDELAELHERREFERHPADAALICAARLCEAVAVRMPGLRSQLHHDSAKLGAGIGVDIGSAYWTVDGAGNPVVVGKGVVGACRVGDQAEAGVIHLTNLAYQKLVSRASPRIRSEDWPFDSKDIGRSMEVRVWRLLPRDILHHFALSAHPTAG